METGNPNSNRRRWRRKPSGTGTGNSEPGNQQLESSSVPRPPVASSSRNSNPTAATESASIPRKNGRNRKRKEAATTEPSTAGASDAESEVVAQPVVALENMEFSDKSSYLTDVEFNTLPVSANLKRAIAEVLRFRFMSQVQLQSIPTVLSKNDVLVKAKTGTGKTLAFMIPSIELLLSQPLSTPNGVRKLLVLSPTRELALQIETETRTLCKFNPAVKLVLFVGGTNMKKDVSAVRDGNFNVLVATPGRLLAHLRETPNFSQYCGMMETLVLDEADRLLDMGFKPDIDQIINFLNQARSALRLPPRQTLLFSATVSQDVQAVARTTLRPGFKFIDTVGEEVEQTHSHVPQFVVSVRIDEQLPALVQLLEAHIKQQTDAQQSYKIILFFPTARQTGYYATVLNSVGIAVLEIHSRKSQTYRTRASDQFRTGKNVIMASSDVSARGMDYPDVTFVVQVGLTDKDQYVHRLGRTARAGKGGSGILLLAPFEYDYMTKVELKEMPLQVLQLRDIVPTVKSPVVLNALRKVREFAASEEAEEAAAVVREFGKDSEKDGAKMAWQAWLGFYNSHCKKLRWTKEQLVEVSAQYASSMGFTQVPTIQKKTVGKMGLQGVPGLRLEKSAPQPPRSNGNNQKKQFVNNK